MGVATINMQLDSEAARIYSSASVERRQQLQMLISTLLKEFDTAPQSLFALMDEISAKAKARGLTPELLERLLNEE
jgi:hypothetical protein